VILIVDRPDGLHAQVVRRHLEARGATVAVADVRELGSGATLRFSPHDLDATEWHRRDGTALRLRDVRAIWHRPGDQAEIPPEIRDRDDRRLSAREWRALLYGAILALELPTINPFRAVLEATKPHQLATALRVGLAVPETLFTNSAAQVEAFVAEREPVVHKTFTGMEDRTLATLGWDERDAVHLPELELAPTIFQRRVPGTREVRVTAVGDRLFAAEFATTFADGRLDRAVTYRPHVLPDEIRRGLLALLDALSLPFAAIDLRIDERGRYWFLELNPAGVFLGIETRTGLPIASAVADLLLAAAGGA
jgi:glutathione synthase/RimK-type ligase-like ATP-grasp enzyme